MLRLAIWIRNCTFDNMKPILKWAGGKGEILDKLRPYIINSLSKSPNGTYYEPFFGGGSVCLDLELPRVVINDYNPEIANVYRQIKEYPQELIQLLSQFETRHNKEEYYRIREWDRQEDYHNRTLTEKASRIIYLNRTCFNGLYRVNKKGQFNTPIGSRDFPFEIMKSRILAISQYFNEASTQISNVDFEECVRQAKKGDVIYFDPPYDSDKSCFNRYIDCKFSRTDLERLKHTCDTLIEQGCSVLISNNKTTFVEYLFEDPRYQTETIYTNRWINSDGTNRTYAEEVIIYGKGY